MSIALTSLMSSSFVNTNSLITDIQAFSIVQSLPDMPQSDPKLPYQHNLSMRNRRLKQGLAPKTYPTIIPRLRSWSYAPGSTLLVIQNSQGSTLMFRDLTVSILDHLMKAGVPTLWALDSNADDEATSGFMNSTEEVLKYLLRQVMQLVLPKQTEARAASFHAQLSRAKRVQDFAQLLGACLQYLQAVYIVIDIESQSLDNGHNTRFCLVAALIELFDGLVKNGSQTHVKVVMTCRYDIDTSREISSISSEDRIQVCCGPSIESKRPVGFGGPRVRGKGRGTARRGRF